MPGCKSDSLYHEYVILGAGPGGVQLGYYFEIENVDYIVLEKADIAGSFYQTFPRRRKLISFNRVNTIFDDPAINLRFDWNSLLTEDHSSRFSEISSELYPDADDLVTYLNQFARRHGINIKYGVEVASIQKSDDGIFTLTSSDSAQIRCKKLIVASGFSKSFCPDIEGLEICEHYADAPISPESFHNQKVLIIGKGNSAFEVADIALETSSLVHIASPNPIKLAWQSRHPGHVRANHLRLLDSYQLKLLNGTLDCKISNISRAEDSSYIVRVEYVHADGEVEELIYDRVIVCAGFKFDDSIFADSCKPHVVIQGKLPATTPFWESVNVSGLYFAGTLMQARDFKRSSSAFIGGFRYNIRTLARHLLGLRLGTGYPFTTHSLDIGAIAAKILDRASNTSGLWAQFKYLCDVLIVQGPQLTWLEELPVQAIEEGLFSQHESYLTLSFEWGDWDGDVMAIERHPTADKAFTNVFLHPILRSYHKGVLIDTHHILEDLFGVYSSKYERGNVKARAGKDMHSYHDQEHYLPLVSFLEDLASGKLLNQFTLELSNGANSFHSGIEPGWDG